MEKSQWQIENEEKRTKWEGHLKAWEESGFTQTEYCRHHGLSIHQFTYWKSHFNRNNGANTLVAVQINSKLFQPEPAGKSSLRLNIENGLQIEIDTDFDPSLLSAVIRTVRGL